MAIEDWHKSVREFIPAGFDLSLYEACENYGAGEWLLETVHRKVTEEMLVLSKEGSLPDDVKPSFYFGLFNQRNEFLDYNPEARGGFNDVWLTFESYSIREMLNKDLLDFYDYAKKTDFFGFFFQALEGLDIEEINIDTEKARKIMTEKLNKLSASNIERLSVKFDDVFDCYPAYPKTATLLVDTEAPDEVLKRDFEDWLLRLRNSQNRTFSIPAREGVKITETLLKSLYKNRVLPYLDIKQWLRSEGIKQPLDHQWPYILFPCKGTTSYEKSLDNFKKQTIRQANWLINDGYHLLRYALSNERQPKNAPNNLEKNASAKKIKPFARFDLAGKENR